MRKILLALGILSITAMNANAYLYESETSSIDTLRAQGFSRSMLEATDWANAKNGGKHTKYVRHFQPKSTSKAGRAYQYLKTYVDPIQDDGKFGDHQIQFTNTWSGDTTHYSSDLELNKQVENL